MTRRGLLKSLPAGLVGLLGGAGALPFGPAFAAGGSSITIAYPAGVATWDPTIHVSPLATAITQSLYDPPIQLTPDLKLAPGVVRQHRWLDETSQTLELEFRDDVIFHNGDALSAEDFKYTYFDRPQADPALQLASTWGAITESVELVSPHRAIMHLSAPMPTAPYQLAEMGATILPKAYHERMGEVGFLNAPIGSGPYRLVDFERDSRIVMEANERYWAGAPAIKRLVFQIMTDPTARAAAMQAGHADLTINLSVRETERLDAAPGLVGTIYPTASVYLLHMVNKGPFTDRNMRLAAHHAIDKAALSRAFFSAKAKSLSMLSPPGTDGYTADFNFAYDLEEAKRLVTAAGYGPGNPARVKLHATHGAYASDFDIARAIVDMWKKAGIEAELKILSLSEYQQLTHSGKIEGPALWSWYTTTGTPSTYGYILDPGKMFSVWKSDDVAAKFAEIERLTTYDGLVQSHSEMQRWAVSQGYTIPLLQGTITVVHKETLHYAPFANGSNRPYYWSL